MKQIITDEQKEIIVKLAGDVNSKEFGAITKFGAQMYHDGIIVGATLAAIGAGIAAGVITYHVITKKLK